MAKQPSMEDSAKWLRSYSKVSKWMQQYDIMALLEQHGGICRIRNFLPANVAEHAYQMVRHVPEPAWHATGAADDYRQNNIDHFFWSTKHASSIQSLLRIFSILLPGKLHTFSAARYDASHHIAPHDDRAYTDVVMEDGEVVECSRRVAVIYYLTKDWRPEWGGHLVDLEGGGTLVPEFNSVVAFIVPRYHQVTPVTGPHPRYSVFGWFLEPGQLYDLYAGDEVDGQEAVNALQDSEAAGHQLQYGPAWDLGQPGHGLAAAQDQQLLHHHLHHLHHIHHQQHNRDASPLAAGMVADPAAAAAGTGSRHKGPKSKRRRQVVGGPGAAASAGSGAAAEVAAAEGLEGHRPLPMGYTARGSALGYTAAGSASGFDAAGSALGFDAAGSASGYATAGSASGYAAAGSASGYAAAGSASAQLQRHSGHLCSPASQHNGSMSPSAGLAMLGFQQSGTGGVGEPGSWGGAQYGGLAAEHDDRSDTGHRDERFIMPVARRGVLRLLHRMPYY